MKVYEFEAGGLVFGRYAGETIQQAREAFARDAGYRSWSDMIDLAAEHGGNSVVAREVMENGQLGVES